MSVFNSKILWNNPVHTTNSINYKADSRIHVVNFLTKKVTQGHKFSFHTGTRDLKKITCFLSFELYLLYTHIVTNHVQFTDIIFTHTHTHTHTHKCLKVAML
jgi:hypothetical protein